MKRIQHLSRTAAAPLLLLLAVAGCATPAPTPPRRALAELKAEQAALTPARVLESLRHGNERFAAGKPAPRDMLHDQQVTAAGQYPHAVILSCIDSRAPAEFVFDQGLSATSSTPASPATSPTPIWLAVWNSRARCPGRNWCS